MLVETNTDQTCGPNEHCVLTFLYTYTRGVTFRLVSSLSYGLQVDLGLMYSYVTVKTIHFRLPIFLINISLKLAGCSIVFRGPRPPGVELPSADCPLTLWPAHLRAWTSSIVSNGAYATSGKFMKKELPWDFPWSWTKAVLGSFPTEPTCLVRDLY